MDPLNKEELLKLQANVVLQRIQEQQAQASKTTETLAALKVSIDGLPLKCQQLLHRASESQTAMDIDHIDPAATFYKRSNVINTQLELFLSVQELKQKNLVLKKEVSRNEEFIQSLKRELRDVKESLSRQNPNPDTIQECLRETKQKLASYEEVYEKAKLKHSKLSLPAAIHPASLQALCARIDILKVEESSLAQRADDITLAKQARDTLYSLT